MQTDVTSILFSLQIWNNVRDLKLFLSIVQDHVRDGDTILRNIFYHFLLTKVSSPLPPIPTIPWINTLISADTLSYSSWKCSIYQSQIIILSCKYFSCFHGNQYCVAFCHYFYTWGGGGLRKLDAIIEVISTVRRYAIIAITSVCLPLFFWVLAISLSISPTFSRIPISDEYVDPWCPYTNFLWYITLNMLIDDRNILNVRLSQC